MLFGAIVDAIAAKALQAPQLFLCKLESGEHTVQY